jgi:hypothetical protein
VVPKSVQRIDQALSARQLLLESNQSGELLLLLGNPIGIPAFIRGTRVGSRLLDQLPYILPRDGNPLLDLGE